MHFTRAPAAVVASAACGGHALSPDVPQYTPHPRAQVRLKYLLKVQFNYKPGKG